MECVCTRSRTQDLWSKTKHVFTSSALYTEGVLPFSENFFWQNMYKDTKNFVRSCTVRLSRKNAFKILPAPHQPVEQSQEPGETCHIDIFGPLKTMPKDDLQPDETEVKGIVPSPRYNLKARACNSAH
ncbi:integrase_H2C2 domain-containing protein [Trichonephila clavipes]|nr:integrase_H2C2 domain-containing protein [Trichonephila clavipes]